MKESFLKRKKNKTKSMEKTHPNSASRPTLHGHQRCQDNSPGSQVGSIGFSWWLSKNHESCRRFHNCLYLPCENEASISARHIWGEPNYWKDFKLEHDMNWIANQHQGFGWSNQRVLPQHPSSRDCWRSLTKYPKVGACEVSGYSSVKDAAEHTFLVANYLFSRKSTG